MTYDVIVVGLGGMGSAAAAALARRGQRVLGLERFGPAHAQGSSHGGSRIIRQSYFEDPSYVPLVVEAYALWERLEAESGAELLTRTGGLLLGAERSRTVSGSLASARRWDLAHELLDASDIRHRFPTFAPGPDVVALYEAAAGLVRPERAVGAQLARAEALDATLRFDEPVLRWDATPGAGVRVTTAAGVHEAGRLVLAPGAWAPRVLADLGLPLVVERQVQYWFAPARAPERFALGRHPIWIWEAEDGLQPYGFPALELGQGVKVALFRAGGPPTTPETVDRTVHPEEVAVVRRYVAERLPDLDGPLLDAVTCFYTTTPDEHFVVARHPGHDQVAIAAGFSGHGFKFVPVIGEILADLVLDGATTRPIELFDPARLVDS